MKSIRDVAALAGVSAATVSRVINNDQQYKMKEETRNRVWKAVAELGYKLPQPRGQEEKQTANESYTLGCVLSVTKEKYRDPYFMTILSGLESRLEEKGCSLSFVKTFFDLQDRKTLHETFENPPDGLILMDTLQPEIYDYARRHVPICVGIDTSHADIDNISYDQFGTGLNAVRFLISRGHKEIAFIGGCCDQSNDLQSNKRYMGYVYAMLTAGLKIRPEFVMDCAWQELVCIEQVKTMMAIPFRPTALFCASDLMAMASLSALYSMGFKVPDEVAVIGITNIELSEFSSPPLTTYEIPAFEMGVIAADICERRIKGQKERDYLPRQVILPTKQILRASV
jgi:LacI family transcriptional regulator